MITHNSHLNEFRQPFGAVVHGDEIRITLHTLDEWLGATVYLRLWQNSRGQVIIPMQASDDGHIHSAVINTAEFSFDPLWYYFIIEKSSTTVYYGNNQEKIGGLGAISATEPPSYQITLYTLRHQIPDWFTKGIIYQIFPDRFYRTPTDKLPESRANCLIHTNWSDTPLYVLDANSGDKLDVDYFGGTLKGIMKKLPYLQELGVSIIYLNPIFEAASNHRYNTADYLKVDTLLGNNEDFTKLCARAAEYEIKVILDGVFSHTGSDSLYFNKQGNYSTVGAYQSTESPFYNWFKFKDYPTKYDCWWDVSTLPNTNELDPSFQDFIINNPGSVLKHWMNAGAGGWRLDVADELPMGFLRNFYQTLKTTDPDSILIGEVWEDATNKVSYGELRNYMDGQTMDSVMNYPLRSICIDFILHNITAEQAANQLMSLYENYPRHNFYALMNLLGSHDRPRILSLVGQALRGKQQAQYLDGDALGFALQRLKLLTVWQMTFPGIPCIYYGDEVGMQGGTDPYNRSCYPWGQENKELLSWYKQLTGLRSATPALTDGDWQIVYAQEHILAYTRTLDNSKLLIVLNSGYEDTTINLDLPAQKLLNVLDNSELTISHNHLELELPAISGQIYKIQS